MKGTEKQIKWAEDLLEKMHTEFTACKEIAPAQVHGMLDDIEATLKEAHAGDVIDLLKGNNKAGQEYFNSFRGRLQLSGCQAAKVLKDKYYTTRRK